MLTLERLKEVLLYEQDTGLFYWKIPTAKRIKAGDVAGNWRSSEYVRIAIDNKDYKAHRLAWFYTYEVWPDGDIDHINTVKNDNRIVNLRDDTEGWNTQNQLTAQKSNKLGVLGVRAHRNKFVAQIFVDGRSKHIGSYNTPEEAHAAYIKVKRELHPGNTL